MEANEFVVPLSKSRPNQNEYDMNQDKNILDSQNPRRLGLLNDVAAQNRGRNIVAAWLFVGIVLVLGQIVIGGITRLTDSGLSITEWEVVKGTIPPLNDADWNIAFEKYKNGAVHQFERQNFDMTLSEFKVIYFWEWFHRFWARSMGFIFIFPFFYFLAKRYFSKKVVIQLGTVVFLAAMAAVMGWLMVRSGLQFSQEEVLSDITRTRVSAYRLIIHLIIATSLFGTLWWTYLGVKHPVVKAPVQGNPRRFSWWVTGVLVLQILLGGLMAGTKAGLVHPHFPFFVEGGNLVKQLANEKQLDVDNFVDYEKNTTPQAWIQVSHRFTAYLLTFMVLALFFRINRQEIGSKLRIGNYMLISMLAIQFALGVLTVIYSIGRIPPTLGVLHQGVALILFATLLYVVYHLKDRYPALNE